MTELRNMPLTLEIDSTSTFRLYYILCTAVQPDVSTYIHLCSRLVRVVTRISKLTQFDREDTG
eukprot:IDg15591t1